MHLVTFEYEKCERIGVLLQDVIADVTVVNPDMPTCMLDLIERGEEGLALIRTATASAPRLSAKHVRLLAPIPRPRKNIFCVGKNYREHAREFAASGFDATATNSVVPDVLIVFSKAPTTVIGPNDPIPGYLDVSNSVDYENELAVIIGKKGRGIRKSEALSHVFGYTIVNDVTARTLQKRHAQWFIGKNLDGFCPMGPVIVTADEIKDVGTMRVTTKVNGELRQDALVSDLIFDIPILIETISMAMTLEPGDIIATGTPPGVGIGFSPPKFLRRGDVVSARIDPIGELTNVVH